MNAYLTRAVHFSASHRYHRPEWSEAENRKHFGDCALPEGHGHNYRCEVSVFGEIDPATGMVIDLGDSWAWSNFSLSRGVPKKVRKQRRNM